MECGGWVENRALQLFGVLTSFITRLVQYTALFNLLITNYHLLHLGLLATSHCTLAVREENLVQLNSLMISFFLDLQMQLNLIGMEKQGEMNKKCVFFCFYILTYLLSTQLNTIQFEFSLIPLKSRYFDKKCWLVFSEQN